MAYNHQMTELQLTASAQLLTAAADIVTKEFLCPTAVRMVAVRVTTTATVTAPVVDVYRRPTAGSDTSRVLLKRLTAALASWTATNWVYGYLDPSDDNVIKPGEDLIVEVSTTATAGAGHVYALVNPSWEVPANIAVMVESLT